jgi:hypothetical protein
MPAQHGHRSLTRELFALTTIGLLTPDAAKPLSKPLLRRYGIGVPDSARALGSATDVLMSDAPLLRHGFGGRFVVVGGREEFADHRARLPKPCPTRHLCKKVLKNVSDTRPLRAHTYDGDPTRAATHLRSTP